MEQIHKSVTELIGNTPLLELVRIEKAYGLKARILAKLESFNPAGSAKDRVALELIRDAEEKHILKEGGTIIEPTSGNTGIGLAAVAPLLGYHCIIVLPDTMSVERQNIIRAYGAEIVLTPGAKGMAGAIQKAEELKREIPGSMIAGQFDNPANAMAHYKTTGPEIYAATEGRVDYFVAGVGTGGTVTGTGRYLKEQNPDIKVVAMEPKSSPLLSGGEAGSHEIQGIGANFIPKVLDQNIYDEVITVDNEDAFFYGKELAKKECILVGISSGAALCAAIELAKRKEAEGKTIVVLFPDGGDRYYSTKLFQEDCAYGK